LTPPLQQWSRKIFPLRLRSSRHFTQRRSERKENTIADLPTSIDNYTTISSTLNLKKTKTKKNTNPLISLSLCRGFGTQLERLPTSVRVLMVL